MLQNRLTHLAYILKKDIKKKRRGALILYLLEYELIHDNPESVFQVHFKKNTSILQDFLLVTWV